MTTRCLVLKTLARGPRTAQELLDWPLPRDTDTKYLWRVLDDLRKRGVIQRNSEGKWELSQVSVVQ
jgi:hypothetical protein